MTRIENTIFCEGCGTEITWAPILVTAQSGSKHDYCCQDCRDGLECECGRRMEVDDEMSSLPD